MTSQRGIVVMVRNSIADGGNEWLAIKRNNGGGILYA